MVCSRAAGVARFGRAAAGVRATGTLSSRLRPALCPIAARRTGGLVRFAAVPENNPAASTAPPPPTEGSSELPLYTNFSDALEDWQLVLLEEAFRTSSRRKISITELSEECKLSRSQVLGWIKSRSRMTEEQAATVAAACLAAVEREERLEDTLKKKEAKKAFAGMSIGERRQVQSKDKQMSALAMKTLLKYWARNNNPSWQSINDIARVTKLSPTIVRNWFKEKRDTNRGSKSARRGRGAGKRF